MDSGWLKLYRSLERWEWFKDSQTLHVFILILINANHKDGKWRGIPVKRGQWITGRKTIAEKTGISEQSIRTILVRLKSSGEIRIKPTNRYSLIKVVNWDSYQPDIIDSTSQLTSNQPAINQQSTTNKNEENEKNEKKTPVKRFKPPSIKEINEYAEKLNYIMDAERFWHFYNSKDWMIGKNKMKSWQSAVVNWNKRDKNKKTEKVRFRDDDI